MAEIQDISGLPAPQTVAEYSVMVGEVIQQLVTWWRETEQDMTPEEMLLAGQMALVDRRKAQVAELVRAEAEDVDKLVADFLALQKSKFTLANYTRGLQTWLSWCAAQGIHPLRAKPRDADLFSAVAEGKDSMVNIAMDAASSWYTTLIRWEKIQHTPFQNVKRRVVRHKMKHIPSLQEVTSILDYVKSYKGLSVSMEPLKVHAAIYAMAYRGFRVGALHGLEVEDDRFQTGSKGKAWTGKLLWAAEVLRPLGKRPFADCTTEKLRDWISYRTERMRNDGLLRYAYSAHDFRHHFASMQYPVDHDLNRIRVLMNHASIEMTVRYLHDLGLMEGGAKQGQ